MMRSTTMLQFKSVNTIEVEDWDSLVQETYNKPYSFQQQDGCKSRGVRYMTIPDNAYDYKNAIVAEVINGDEMGVSFAAWLARDPKEWNGSNVDKSSISVFWYRNFYPNVQTIANDLYDRGLVPSGDYVINIDW